MEAGYSSDGSDEEDIINARAAALIMDAMEGENRPIPAHGEVHVKAHVLRRRMLWLVRLWSLLGLLIEFFVEPGWCLDRPDRRCPGTAEYFYMSGTPKIRKDSLAMLVVNLIYLLPFLVDLGLRLLAYGQSFWTVLVQKCYLLVVISYGLISWAEYFKAPTSELLAVLRPLVFLLLHPSVRREVHVVLRSIPQVLELFFLGFLLLLFFSLVAIILFPVTTREGNEFFPSLPAGMWSLLVLMTTANFPDVMLPSYEVSRSAVLYFLIFMIVAMFFLVNVLTAIVMNAYQRQGAADRAVLKETRQKKLSQAYDLLTLDADHQSIPLTLERMDAVVGELQRFQEFQREDLHNRISQTIDSSGDGVISRTEFGSLIWITKQLAADSSPPVLERCFPNLADSRAWQAAKSLASSEVPGFVIDILLTLNFMDIIVKLWPEIVGVASAEESIDDRRAAIAGWVQQTFTLILLFDTLFKVITLGLHRYLSTHINQFDFAITCIVVIISMLGWFPWLPLDHCTLARISQCARLFRFCRLLDRYKPYHHFGRIAFKLLPAAVDVVMVVALISYVFAVFGVFLFGGVINEDPHNPYFARVSESSFGQAKYYVNNFNDLGMGMVTLFELLVVNNWFIISDGFSAACGSWARVYFVAYWALGVLVGLNLFLSTIIGAFIDEYEELDESHFQLPDFSHLSAAASQAAALGDALMEDVKNMGSLYEAPRSNRILIRESR